MLRRVAADDPRNWDQMLPYVLFGIGKSPRPPRIHPLRTAVRATAPGPARCRPGGLGAAANRPSVHDRAREGDEGAVERVMPLVREQLAKAQEAQRRNYDRAAQPRESRSEIMCWCWFPRPLASSWRSARPLCSHRKVRSSHPTGSANRGDVKKPRSTT